MRQTSTLERHALMPKHRARSFDIRRTLRTAGSSFALVALGASVSLRMTSARAVATSAPAASTPAAGASIPRVTKAPAAPAAPSSQEAASCRLRGGPRLPWVEEGSPAATRVYRSMGKGQSAVPEIYKAMSLRPDLMERVADLTDRAHFQNGFLDRRTKELIATYVSSLNSCGYCTGSHRANLRALGTSARQARAVARQDLASLPAKERRLLAFVKTLTLSPARVSDEDVRSLRRAGWRDEQIFEAAFETSLFAFFNRMAETYGLDAPVDELASARVARPMP